MLLINFTINTYSIFFGYFCAYILKHTGILFMNLDHVKICFFNYISVLMKNIALLPWREQVLVFIITLMDFFHL